MNDVLVPVQALIRKQQERIAELELITKMDSQVQKNLKKGIAELEAQLKNAQREAIETMLKTVDVINKVDIKEYAEQLTEESE